MKFEGKRDFLVEKYKKIPLCASETTIHIPYYDHSGYVLTCFAYFFTLSATWHMLLHN